MSADKMQATFEVWAKDKFALDITSVTHKTTMYKNVRTNYAWLAWQEVSTVQAAEIARLAAELVQSKESAASWEQTAHTKCAQLADEIAGRCNDRIAERLAAHVIEQEPVSMPGVEQPTRLISAPDCAHDVLMREMGWADSSKSVEQEPVMEINVDANGDVDVISHGLRMGSHKLYASPQPSADDARDAMQELRDEILHGIDGLDNDQTNAILSVFDYHMEALMKGAK